MEDMTMIEKTICDGWCGNYVFCEELTAAGDAVLCGPCLEESKAEVSDPNAHCPCGSGKKFKKCHG